MSDANIRIPAEARDRLAEIAAAEGLSLRAYLARLAASLLTQPSAPSAPSRPGQRCVSGTATTPARATQPPSTLSWTGG